MKAESHQATQGEDLSRSSLSILCCVFVLLTSFFTYFFHYDQPQAPFWDENYYITDAERILNGVFFMQIHPPLGKLLIAAGEAIFDPNESDAQFLETEHAGEFPQDFSFVGYRFFPALLGWLTVPLFFLCLLLLTRNPLVATLLSFLIIFDNALLVHSRGAMLDAPLHFFFVLTCLLFLLLVHTKNRSKIFLWLSGGLGISIGLAVATKMNGAILFLFFPALLWHLRREWKSALATCVLSGSALLIAFMGVWYVHLSRMEIIRPALRDSGWYTASEEYKEILQQGAQRSLLAFPIMLRDHLQYAPFYNQGIPKLDLCKPDENGSPVFLWPFGVSTINYRWASAGENTYRYLYLVPNPAIWFVGLMGILLSAAFLLSPLFGAKRSLYVDRERAFIGTVFLMIYMGYVATFSMMDRVHFLYSYFPALIISFLLFGIVFSSVRAIGSFHFTEERKTLVAMFLACLIFLCFQIYRPFTYYEPITNDAVKNRSILRLWNLHCVGCEKPSSIVRHQCDA
ncbi:MAG TPA: phospholipid carrier-dependent glycosyltransferase [Candidatus Peribacterales bacterium]|nr:phospholipid carrier-dependent glycosyltransferase [Candidatus Peribacterales bacterium]